MKYRERFNMAVIPAAVLLLSACGGGGSDNDGGSGGGPSVPASASGTAGKGIIIGGAVEALEITAGRLESRGTTVTNSAGGYSLDISSTYGGGPLVIRISGGGSAAMKCDVQAGCGATLFGNTLPLSSSFVMNTLLPAVDSGADLQRCITPLTHLAAARAAELAGGNLANVTAANANAALSEVGSLVGGLDVLRTCIIDLTDPAKVADATSAQLAASGLAAAVLSIGETGNPAQALADLAEDFVGGVIAKADLQALIDSASSELAAVDPGAENNVAYLQVAQNIENTDGDTIDPMPNANVSSPALAQGKALVEEVRSLARNLMQDADGAETNPTVTAFIDEIDTAAAAVDATPLFEAFGFAFESAEAFYISRAEGSGSGTLTLNSTDSNDQARIATITVNKPASGNHTVSIVGAVRDFTVNISVTAPPDVTVGGNLSGMLTASMANASGSGLSVQLSGAAAAGSTAYDKDTDTFTGDFATFNGAATVAQVGVADPLKFDGDIKVEVVACTSCADSVEDEDGNLDDGPAYNVDLLQLDGAFTRSDASIEANVTVDMDATAARAFDIRLPVSAGNEPTGTVSVRLEAGLDDFHDYGVAVVLDLDNITSLEGGASRDLSDINATLTASLQRDTNTITVTAVTRPPTASANVVNASISNQDGVTLRFNNVALSNAPVTGTVFVGETRVGTVEETEDGVILIRWVDGSFESLG